MSRRVPIVDEFDPEADTGGADVYSPEAMRRLEAADSLSGNDAFLDRLSLSGSPPPTQDEPLPASPGPMPDVLPRTGPRKVVTGGAVEDVPIPAYDLGRADRPRLGQKAMTPDAPPPPDAIAQGGERDRMNALMRAIELGGKQMIGGLGGTPVAELVTQRTDYEGQARQQAATDAQKSQAAAIDRRNFDATERDRVERRDAERQRIAQADAAARAMAAREEGRDKDRDKKEAAAEAEKPKKEALAAENLALHRRSVAAQEKAAGVKAGEATEKKATAAAGAVMPFREGAYEPTGLPLPEQEISKVREKVAAYGKALGGIDRLESGILDYAKAPSLEAKNNLSSRIPGIAAALTAANGGGVMADSEFLRASRAMGSDVVTPEGVAAVLNSFLGESPEKGARLLLSKIRSVKDETRKNVDEMMQPYQYTFKTKALAGEEELAPPPETRTVVRNPKTGERRYLRADGSLGELVQ